MNWLIAILFLVIGCGSNNVSTSNESGSTDTSLDSSLDSSALKGGKPPKADPTPTPVAPQDLPSSVIALGSYVLPQAMAMNPVTKQLCVSFFNYIIKGQSELKYGCLNGSTWEIQSLGFKGGDYGPSSMNMKFDSAGHPTIAFSNTWESGTNNGHLWVVSSDGLSWKTESLDFDTGAPLVAMGPNGKKYISYLASAPGGALIYLAENSGTGWTTSAVDDSNVAGGTRYEGNPSIAVDNLGNVAVTYTYYIIGYTKQVRYAYRSNGVWKISTLHYNIGGSTALVFDSSNRPQVFFKPDEGLYAARADALGNWSKELVPNINAITFLGSLSLDSNGAAFMSVFNYGPGDLQLVSGTSGNYTNQLLAGTGTVGKSNSLVIDPATNKKYVSFTDESLKQLRLITLP
ncbi:MAG TPA: hypothetical protein VI895_04100 [Bdellovibrionota bacterium]|nr:hypothetical protein [Bdellovibrionota bacterium]